MPSDEDEMLREMGLRSVDDLFADIPAGVRIPKLDIPDGLPEDQVEKLRVIAAKCPVHRALEGEVMFQERIERVHLAA